MARNDITGDELISKAATESYRKGWEAIDWTKKVEDDKKFDEEVEVLTKINDLNNKKK